MAFNFDASKTTSGFTLPTTSATATKFTFQSGSTPPAFSLGTGSGDAKLVPGTKPSEPSGVISSGFTLSSANTILTTTAGGIATTGLTFGIPSTVSSGFDLKKATPTTQFSLGTTIVTTAAATTSATSVSNVIPFSFGTSTTDASKSDAKATTAPTTSAATFTLLGSTGASTVTTASTSAPVLSLGQSSTTVPSSISATVIETPKPMTFAQLEDAINKWTIDLEEQGKVFHNQASQLNSWDRLLLCNGDKILDLHNGIERVKQQQQQMDQELDFILSQQKELEDCIIPLEKELKDVVITDTDRDQTYNLAENIDTKIKQISDDLKDVIEHVNESNRAKENSDPMTQIAKILNAHMNSLQWIDRNTAAITAQLDQISKMHDLNRRNHEMNLQKTYD